MPNVPVYNTEGNKVGDIELNDEIFGAEINDSLMHQVVLMQLANRRRGSASTKTRANVRGGGRKPWRQKGTGRARAGSIRSPLWRKGGVVFGPHPRDYSYTMPKKARRAAMRSALSSKVRADNLVVLESLVFEQPKTKTMANILNRLNVSRKALVIIPDSDPNIIKSARNIVGIKAAPVTNLNVYDVLNHDKLILTKDAVARVEEVLTRHGS